MPAELTYVTRPPRALAGDRAPALLLLHGYGADERDLLSLADALDPRLYVISARAPISLGSGYAWYPLGQNSKGELVPDTATLQTSLETLTRFASALPRAEPIDPARVFTLGFSQGAVMAGGLLLTRPHLPRGTMMLSGYLPLDAVTPAPDGTKAQPVFVAHGLYDPIIPVEAGRTSRAYFEHAGADLTYREYPIAHSITMEEVQDVSNWLAALLK